MSVHQSQAAVIDALTPVLETALDAVVVMRRDGSVAAWNKVAEQTFDSYIVVRTPKAQGSHKSLSLCCPMHCELR